LNALSTKTKFGLGRLCAGRNTSNYTVTITRLEASEVTDLLGLDIWYGHTPVRVVDNWYNNSGLLVPEFNRDVHTYQMEVEHDTSSVLLNATMASFYSILKVPFRSVSQHPSICTAGSPDF